MNNKIIWSDLTFKILTFAKIEVTKKMIIIEINKENNNPKFFAHTIKLSRIMYTINDVSFKNKIYKK